MEGSHEVRKVILTYLCSGISGKFVPNEEVSEIRYFDTKALPHFRGEEQASIEKAMANLNSMWQSASEDMYKNAQQQPQEGPQSGPQPGPEQKQQAGNDEVTDVDFEEVKDK